MAAPAYHRPIEVVLAVEMARTLLRLRWFVMALMAALALKAAVTPAYSWLAHEGVAAMRVADATLLSLALYLVPLAAGIAVAVALVEFGEKLASKAMEARLLVDLQRTYLGRRSGESAPRDVSQVLYGCEVARKGFEVVYKDGWRIPVEITGVLLWQAALGAEWLPLLIGAVIPALGCVWFAGRALERTSRQILEGQRGLAATTAREREGEFASLQEAIFTGTIRFEVLKWLTERGLDAALWLSVAACIATVWWIDPARLPGGGEIAGAAAFLVNLRLLMKPLSDIGKVYTKWREASPAIRPVYALRERLPGEAGEGRAR